MTEKNSKAAEDAPTKATEAIENEIPDGQVKVPEERINLKAKKLQGFLDESKVGFFTMDATGDNLKTVVFRTNITVQKQQLPVGVFTDDSIYSLIRVLILPAVVNANNRGKVFVYLNELNAKYKIFKYYSDGSDNIFLDISLPCLPEHFDPRMALTAIDLAMNHLNEIFFDFMRRVWGE
ncbi:MAG: hypothetical protein LBO03_02475 [Acidaminococcales bacterium]|nr:hypothetical protein [Acidaminococcales bacterium]